MKTCASTAPGATAESTAAVDTLSVPACLLCGEPGGVAYDGLQDARCGTPGRWRWRHCGPCGLLWLDPRPAPGSVAGLYASYYTHQQGDRSGAWARWRERARLALLSATAGYEALAPRDWQRRVSVAARALGPLDEMARLGVMGLDGGRKGRLLDVGCGSGRLLAVMRRAGWEVSGVEPDRRAVAVARERYGLTVHAGGLDDAPFLEQSFDAIVLSHVIEHVADPVALLSGCRRLLGGGGLLALSTPNLASRGHRRFGCDWLHLDVPRHLHLFSLPSLQTVLARAGFREARLTTTAKSAASTWLSSQCGAVSRERFATGAAAGGQRRVGATGYVHAAAFHLAECSAVRHGEHSGEELFAWAEKGTEGV